METHHHGIQNIETLQKGTKECILVGPRASFAILADALVSFDSRAASHHQITPTRSLKHRNTAAKVFPSAIFSYRTESAILDCGVRCFDILNVVGCVHSHTTSAFIEKGMEG